MRRFIQSCLVLLVALGAGLAYAGTPLVDGYLKDPITGVVEAPYVVDGITYTQDQISGEFAGYLFTAEDDENFYFGFSQSVYINDNSYGANGIGWDFKKQGHRFSDLDKSEHAKIQLFDCQGNMPLEFYLDYASLVKQTGEVISYGPGGTDGAMLTGDPAMVTGWSSSLVWNFNNATPLWPDRLSSSPQRVPTNTYDVGTTADPNYPWIYELTYEWSVSKAAFPGACFGDILISEVHNSPFKGANNPVPVPVLTVSKASDPPSGSTVIAGDEILYTINFYNPGPLSITDVLITDVIDPNLSNIIPLDGGTWDESTRTITWPLLPSLGAMQAGSVQFRATVTPLSAQETIIYNMAVISSPDLPTPAETNTTEHPILHSPDLAVTKSCPVELAAGVLAVYNLRVDNLGFGTAQSVVLTDLLPPEVAFISAAPAPASVDGQTVTFDLGNLAYGEYTEVAITVDVVAGFGSAINTATVSTTTPEGGLGLANNSDSCASTLTGPDVYIFKSCPVDMTAGTQASYTLEAGNSGTSPAADVVVTDTLPDGVSFVDAAPAPSSVSGKILTWNLGTLSAGQVSFININVDVTASSGQGTNSAAISTSASEGGEGEANNNHDCTSNFTSADIAVAKICPIDMVAGEAASYTVVVSNTGTATATNVVLVDELPAEVSFISAAPVPSAVSGATLTFLLGDLAPGASTSITIDVSTIATAGMAVNSAFATTDTFEGGQGQANNSDSCASSVNSPDLAIAKTCPVDMVAGQNAGYLLAVSNIGTSAAFNVTVADLLPPGVSFISATPAPSSVIGQEISFSLGTLDAGASASINITVGVDATTGSAVNSASVFTDSVEGGLGQANNSDSCSSGFLAPDVEILKTCPADMIAGQGASYTLLVSNNGTTTATAVVATDILPDGVSFVFASPAPASILGQTLVFELGDMAAGASAAITIDVLAAATAGTATNNATVATTSVEGGAGSANNSDSCSSGFLAPDIAVSKSCPIDMIAGNAASYSIQVDNLGNTAATNVVIVDTLPMGVSFANAAPAPASVVGQVITFALGDLDAGASTAITINVSVEGTSGAVTNAVQGSTDSTEGGQAGANNADSCVSQLLSPILTINKTCPVDMIAGEAASYTLTVNNSGTSAATQVTVTDQLPAGVSFISAVPAPLTVDGQALTFSLGDIDAGASSLITIYVLAEATEGSASNTASVSTASVEGGAAGADNSDSCSSSFLSPDLAVSKECPVDMIAGEGASYTIVISNLGTAAAKNTVITDILPDGVAFLSAVPAPSSAVGQILTFDLGDLAADSLTTIQVNVAVTATAGTATNAVSGTTSSVEGGLAQANNSDSCSSGILSPDLAITKDCPADMVAGEQAFYTIIVSNDGSSTAYNVTVDDLLPASVSFLSATPAPTSQVGQALTFALGDIAAGGSATVSITVNVDDSEGISTNFATAYTDSVEGGQGQTNNSAQCSSNLIAPDLAVDKTCPADMSAGESDSYSILVSNLGSSAANQVILTDALPAGVVFVSAVPAPLSQVGQTLTFDLGTLDAGASTNVVVTVLAVATEGAGTNSASVTTSSVEGGQGLANNDDSCSSNFLSPDVLVVKTCPIDMIAGTGSAYSITVSNLGNTAAKNVVLTDTLPAGVSFLAAVPAPATEAGAVLTFALGDIGAGASVTITIDVQVDATGGAAVNTASATTDSVEGGQGEANNDDSCTSNYLSPDVWVENECLPGTIVASDDYTLKVRFYNDGTTDALGTIVVVDVPDGLFQDNSFAAASTLGATTAEGLVVTVDVGTLAAGAWGEVTVSGTAASSTAARGSYTTYATISTDSTQSQVSNDAGECSVILTAPDLALSKTSTVTQITTTVVNSALVSTSEIVETAAASRSDTVTTSSRIAYIITASNLGDADATGVAIVDSLPAGVTVVSNPDGGVVIGNTVTWDVPVIVAGGSAAVALTVETVTP